MITPATRRAAIGVAVLATGALALSACGSDGGGANADPDGPIELSVATFNDFGYTDELLAEYEAEHDNITIVHNKAATTDDARANYFQKLGSGGLSDIEAVEIDWLPELMEYADLLAPVPDDLKGRWLDWKEEAATDAEGNLVGYGTDIGPESVCYRQDLFAEAGLPTDPEEVAGLFTTWDDLFSVGQDYVDSTGKPFLDSASSVLQALINQQEKTFEDTDNSVIATENPAVREVFDTTVEKANPISAYPDQWSEDWYAAMANGEFAAMMCPPWMFGIIQGEAPDVDDWQIANVFPGGGGNWGGSYLTVPADGDNVEAAQEFADWLTSPETQIKAFKNAGTFPSQPDTYESEELTGFTNEYFGGAPAGQIGIERAEAVEIEPYKGPKYFQFRDALTSAVTRVFNETETADASWDSWVNEVSSF
ncbi:ABC transporter substrate-binding protein [Microbacterium sp. JB110]|uniref:ABC transporter substrate-binding protein n=1 Tax=Microbacterium sp. JB110 TaxID=2024477 RepID=UPI00097EE100|nr:extracellular solute-binding protein [Microbacterium sp. JB110]RCS60161.1 extracellular solute-binding protein [Microbacterium sp. JB110]SJM47894.1 putative sugar binding secreted protein [Frigoribacterium sp. JB110]